MTNLNLNAEQYGSFLRCITNLREVCNDVDLRDGVIRQRSDDKSTVFEMDLKPILTEVNMPISDIKKKLELLKTFSGQEVSISFEDNHFTFSDQFSSLKFQNPTLEYMDNKYISMEELERVFVMDDNELLIDTSLSSMITDRIRVITQTFNTQAIQIVFNGEMANLTAVTQARDQFAKIVSNIVTNAILEGCSSNLSTVPFSIEHDTDVKFKIFKHPSQDVLMNKFDTTIDDINVTIYGRAAIIKDED
ncbi:MAG: hypothetical protein ACTSX6_02160 [Candidatus Heimdallarchaeaceae archaeon]